MIRSGQATSIASLARLREKPAFPTPGSADSVIGKYSSFLELLAIKAREAPFPAFALSLGAVPAWPHPRSAFPTAAVPAKALRSSCGILGHCHACNTATQS